MKKSTKQTRHLLVRAYTNSEYDSCNAMMINVSIDWNKQLEMRSKCISNICVDDGFRCIKFEDKEISFLDLTTEQLDSLFQSEQEMMTWVEIEEDELLPIPSARIILPAVYISCNPFTKEQVSLYWEAIDKHNISMEYFTETVQLNVLISLITEK